MTGVSTVSSGSKSVVTAAGAGVAGGGCGAGPSPGKPVLAPAGMRGDRAQVVFSGLDDLKRFLVAS